MTIRFYAQQALQAVKMLSETMWFNKCNQNHFVPCLRPLVVLELSRFSTTWCRLPGVVAFASLCQRVVDGAPGTLHLCRASPAVDLSLSLSQSLTHTDTSTFFLLASLSLLFFCVRYRYGHFL